MPKTNIKPSTLLLLISLTWIPESLVMLQMIYGKEAGHTSLMKPLLACFELAFVATILIERRQISLPSSITHLRLPLALWVIWMALTTLTSNHPVIAIFRSIEWLSHILFSVALISYLLREKENTQEIVGTLLFGFTLYTVLYAIYVTFYGKGVLGFDHIRHYGHYIIVALLLSLSIPRNDIQSIHSAFKILILTIAWTALFWTGGRGPLLAITVTTITFAFFGLFRNRTHLLAIFSASAIVGFFLSIPLSGPEHGIYRIIHSISESYDIDALSSNRLSIWRASVSDILSHPIFGLGPEGFIYGAGTQFHPILHPHNSLLQFASEWGVPGAILFLWLLYRIYAPSLRSAASAKNTYFFAAVLTGSTVLFYSLFTGNLYTPFSTFLFVIITSIILATHSETKETVSVNKKLLTPVLLIAAGTTVFQGFVMTEFVAPDSKLPEALQTKIFRTAPVFMTHPGSQARVIEWSRRYHKNGEEQKADEWLAWGKESLPRAWMFDYAATELFIERNLLRQAIHAVEAMRDIPQTYQGQVDCLIDRVDKLNASVSH